MVDINSWIKKVEFLCEKEDLLAIDSDEVRELIEELQQEIKDLKSDIQYDAMCSGSRG